MPSCRHAGISVIKTTDHSSGNQLRGTGDWILLHLWNRRITVQALVRSGHVVIIFDVFPEQTVEMSLV